jgi:hypothetical protein
MMHNHLRFFQAFFLLAYFFGVIPGLLLLRTARWVRVAIAAIAFSSALILSWMTIRWFVVSLRALGNGGSEFVIVAAGVHLSSWEFFLLMAMLAAVASGYIVLGTWILKRQARCLEPINP